MPHGKLFVIVESATGIKDPSKHGGGRHPIFHTEFQFEIDRSTSDLVISVYSTGSQGDDKLVGYTTLDFQTVFYHAHTVPMTAYPLLRGSGRAGGHISISLKFKARPSPYAHNPHAPMSQYSAPPAHGQNYEVDGYGSSGSESSRSGITDGRHQEQYYEYHAGGGSSSYEVHHHYHPPPPPQQAQARQSRAPAVAHQAMPNQAIPAKGRGAPQGMHYQQRGQPGVVAQVAGQVAGRVAQAVAVEVAKQSVQAVAGGFGDMLGGVFKGN